MGGGLVFSFTFWWLLLQLIENVRIDVDQNLYWILQVAWVTKSGQSELAEPIAIRPTSETGRGAFPFNAEL